MQLGRIDDRLAGTQDFSRLVVDEAAAQLEEHLHAVNEEEDDHDQQQYCIAAVEDVGVVASLRVDQRVEDLYAEQAVQEEVEGDESQEALRQELRLLPANVAQVKDLERRTETARMNC